MEDHDLVCDDGLSVSTAYTPNDQSSWTDGREFGEMQRPGSKYWPFRYGDFHILTGASSGLQRLSQAVMRYVSHGCVREIEANIERLIYIQGAQSTSKGKAGHRSSLRILRGTDP